MNLNNRQLLIFDLLKKHHAITVCSLSEKLCYSASTIRRDLHLLEKENLIRRTHGGATIIEQTNAEIPLFIRNTKNHIAKELIGRKASSYIDDGDTLFLDSSTTVLKMIPHFRTKKDLTIITNGLATAKALSELHSNRVICTGGTLRDRSLSFIGEHAKNVLSFYNVDKAFFSAHSISATNGISDVNEDEAIIRRLMISNSEHSYLLMDSSKFNRISLCHICSAENVFMLITEAPFKSTAKWDKLSLNIIEAY